VENARRHATWAAQEIRICRHGLTEEDRLGSIPHVPYRYFPDKTIRIRVKGPSTGQA
jgi:hypothetical protein